MKQLTLWVSLLGLVILWGCIPTPTPPPPPPPTGPGLLVAFQGSVQLKRTGWRDFSNIGFGTRIRDKDILKVSDSVTLLCGNFELKSVTDSPTSSPCLGDGSWSKDSQNGLDSVFKAPTAATIPYIEQPRNTVLLEARPILRWQDTGAGLYTVQIQQDGKIKWEAKHITTTELQYPADAPALETGKVYSVVVIDEVSQISSAAEGINDIGFQLLSPQEQATLTPYSQQIHDLSKLNETARNFALASYYAHVWRYRPGRGLFSEALRLSTQVAQSEPAPAVYLLQGDIFINMKLPYKAITAYQQALNQAQTKQDFDTEAIVYNNLWKLTEDTAYCKPMIKLFTDLANNDSSQTLSEFYPAMTNKNNLQFWCQKCNAPLRACN